MLKLVDKIPTIPLIIAALIMGLSPFVPQPHLFEKVKMLSAGQLSTPLDIFDLLLHSFPFLLLLLKLTRSRQNDQSNLIQ